MTKFNFSSKRREISHQASNIQCVISNNLQNVSEKFKTLKLGLPVYVANKMRTFPWNP